MAPLDHSDLSDRGVANINVPLGGQVMSVVISLAAVTVLTLFLSRPPPLSYSSASRN